MPLNKVQFVAFDNLQLAVYRQQCTAEERTYPNGKHCVKGRQSLAEGVGAVDIDLLDLYRRGDKVRNFIGRPIHELIEVIKVIVRKTVQL